MNRFTGYSHQLQRHIRHHTIHACFRPIRSKAQQQSSTPKPQERTDDRSTLSMTKLIQECIKHNTYLWMTIKLML